MSSDTLTWSEEDDARDFSELDAADESDLSEPDAADNQGKIKKESIPLFSTSYVPDWRCVHAFREFYQNWYLPSLYS